MGICVPNIVAILFPYAAQQRESCMVESFEVWIDRRAFWQEKGGSNIALACICMLVSCSREKLKGYWEDKPVLFVEGGGLDALKWGTIYYIHLSSPWLHWMSARSHSQKPAKGHPLRAHCEKQCRVPGSYLLPAGLMERVGVWLSTMAPISSRRGLCQWNVEGDRPDLMAYLLTFTVRRGRAGSGLSFCKAERPDLPALSHGVEVPQ